MWYLAQVRLDTPNGKSTGTEARTGRQAWWLLATERRREERARGKGASRTTWRLRLRALRGKPGRVVGPPAGLEGYSVGQLAHEVYQFGR